MLNHKILKYISEFIIRIKTIKRGRTGASYNKSMTISDHTGEKPSALLNHIYILSYEVLNLLDLFKSII